MRLDVTGHHVEVTTPLREYVVSKIEKIERHFDLVTNVHCILTVEKQGHKAEATVSVNGGNIYADATEDSMYAAIHFLTIWLLNTRPPSEAKNADHHARDSDKRQYS